MRLFCTHDQIFVQTSHPRSKREQSTVKGRYTSRYVFTLIVHEASGFQSKLFFSLPLQRCVCIPTLRPYTAGNQDEIWSSMSSPRHLVRVHLMVLRSKLFFHLYRQVCSSAKASAHCHRKEANKRIRRTSLPQRCCQPWHKPSLDI